MRKPVFCDCESCRSMREKARIKMSRVTVFYAHSSGDDLKAIAHGCKEIRELIRAKGERAGKE